LWKSIIYQYELGVSRPIYDTILTMAKKGNQPWR
jgi:hypothetical protein